MSSTIKDLKQKIENLSKKGFGDDTRLMSCEDLNAPVFEFTGDSMEIVGTGKSTGKEEKLVFFFLSKPDEFNHDDDEEDNYEDE